MSRQNASCMTATDAASPFLAFQDCPPCLKTRIILFFLAIAGMWFGFANPIAHIPLLALLYPAILTFFALCAKSARSAFIATFLTGALGSSATLYWIAVPVHDYGGLPWIAAVPCALLLGAYLGLYAGVFGWAMRAGSQKVPHRRYGPLLLAIAGGCLWTALEHARGFLFSGFPWLTLSSAFASWPFAIQGASIFGSYALSGIFTGLSIAASLGGMLLFSRPRSVDARTAALPVLTLCGIVLLGLAAWTAYRLNHETPKDRILTVLMVQGNIDQNQKWIESYQSATLKHYIGLTAMHLEKAGAPKPQLVVWPETAMPFFFQSHPLGRDLLRAVQSLDIPLLFGAPGFTSVTGVARSKWPIFNRAYLLVPGQSPWQTYEKEHLVPFGEYLPSFLDFPALQILFQGVGAFSKGTRTAPLQLDNLALGVLICYETIFPELAQARVDAGASVLVNISNDAWFGLTSAPLQHLHQTVMRAVEQGRFFVRCTNTGITAIIDNKGRIVHSGGLYIAETLSGAIPAIHEKTIFHMHGTKLLVVMYGICFAFFAPPCFSSVRRRSL